MKFAVAAAALTLASAVSAVCLQEYTAKANDTCQSVAQAHGVDVEVLSKLNSELSAVCNKLVAGKSYCIASGLSKRAKKSKKPVHKKKVTKKAKKSSHKKPAKKHTKKPAAKKPAAKKPAAKTGGQSHPGDTWSSTPKNAPKNAVRHITPNCKKYSTVTKKDSWCGDFAKRNGISTNNLYKWNAGLHSSGKHVCDNLDDGKAYCVGI
ncbi:hypothetical protein BY458DRAFT_557934 [Sporodiniella umbellata]|nr:hypothetical protein BY458DRAFT_557934 [Sporodiniella umbellata]